MLRKLFQRSGASGAGAPRIALAALKPTEAAALGGPAPGTPRAPILDLSGDPGLRLFDAGIAGGFAAVVSSRQGLFIINRNDIGVGWQLATYGAYMAAEVAKMEALVRAAPPDPVVLDIGANIGVVAVCLARAAGPGGVVHAFEAQRMMFNMLAGNAALNAADNLVCHPLAVGAHAGSARIPRLDYRGTASFGSLELNRETQSDLGQQAAGGAFDEVPMQAIDALGLERVDMIKIDVEGMEAAVLEGAARTIAAQRPLMYVEYIKSGREELGRMLAGMGYELYDAGDNFICFPQGDARASALCAGLTAWQPGAPAQS